MLIGQLFSTKLQRVDRPIAPGDILVLPGGLAGMASGQSERYL